MTNDDSLTAAECSTRTGLTVRALRVYEEYGLVAPRRSAGGWRLYGETELIRLNTISVLKAAGLSLAEIKAMTNACAFGPPLQDILNIQLEALQRRRAEIEYGQAIVEAALITLNNHESLAIDKLCNLIRSIDMSEPVAPTATDNDHAMVTVDAATLERYAGHYQLSENSIINITTDGTRLYSRPLGWEPYELTPQSPTEYYSAKANATLTFMPDENGNITSLTFHSGDFTMTAMRIDSTLAQSIRHTLTERIQNQTPVPGSEAALRRMLDGIACNQPNYNEMNAAFASLMRKALPQFHAGAIYLGSIQSIEFKGVGNRGWDVYEVKRERGTSRWRIAYESSGIITGAMGVVIDMPISAGP
jgi:DNA-binding transcriptional MerR regulator